MRLFLEVKATLPDFSRMKGAIATSAKRPLTDSANKMVRIIKDRIKKGVPPPLARSTKARKKRLGQRLTPLYAKGVMYRAIYVYPKRIAGLTSGMAIGIRQRGKPDRRWLAVIHNEGMGNTPMRRFFYISRYNWETDLRGVWSAWFRRMMSTRNPMKTEKLV